MSITKTSIWTSNNFYESGIGYYSDSTKEYQYAPTKDVTNSCITGQLIRFEDIPTTQSTNVTLRVELDLSWGGGFDTSSTAGTFAMHFQGANYQISTGTTLWQGTNYINAALNAQQNLTNLVTSKTSGIYHYNCQVIIPASYFATYNGGYIGIRTNYANNGTAWVKISNIKVYPDKYYCDNSAHISKNNETIGYQFYEI